MKAGRTVLLLAGGLLCAGQVTLADTPEDMECLLSRQPSVGDPATNSGADKDFFDHAYAEAECLRKAAAKAGAEWLETEELLLRSTAEAAKGNWRVALGLVEKARFQAWTALRQAEYEAQAWKRRVIQP